jgi:hypothetical protein
MKGIMMGIVIGFVVATVGITGVVGLLDSGLNVITEHAPIIEGKINELKNYTEKLAQ